MDETQEGTPMSHCLEDVMAAVLALPEEDRVEIIDAALASLADPGPLSEEWKAEIDRRSREINSGEVELIKNEEVFARVRARLR
jgi:putative addiction module component (TIGR02574 family)